MNSDLYERQLKWREDAKKKAIANSAKAESDKEEKELTFKPHIYTAPVKKFEGSARALTEKSGANHVLRQAKARKDKQETNSTKTNKKFSSLLPVEADHEYAGSDDHKEPDNIAPSSRSFEFDDTDTFPFPKDDTEIDEESLVETLERERREWQADRLKLIHCIHLQQLELTQRAVASHERAADIAQEFARAIEGFEERLVSVENNVHKEISVVKSVAESLVSSSQYAADAAVNSGNIEQRLNSLEDGMTTILGKLDAVLQAVSRK